MKNNNKGAVNIWLVVLIVAVVAAGGYFAFQKSGTSPATDQPEDENQVASTDETAGWQTYRNEKYRFEVVGSLSLMQLQKKGLRSFFRMALKRRLL